MSAPRVGFDVSPLARPHPPSLVRTVREVVAALEERGRLEVVRLAPDAGRDLRRWRQRGLPRAVSEQGLLGVHSFVSAFALRGPGRRVHTVHELPWRHGVRENADLRHRFWAGLGSRRADRVLCPSEHVARPLRARRGAGVVRVVPWGVGPEFCEEPPPGVVDEALLGRYRLPEGALALAPGATRAKKDLPATLRGLARLRERGGPAVQLVVTGEESADLRRDLGLVSRLGLARFVSTPGFVPDADLPGLYRLAAVVPVLSRSEGFGMPVLEALACGTPVVVAEQSAQAEVAGPQGIAVDPADADAVADGIARAVEEREALRYALPERAREFPWSRSAAGIEETWLELAG